MKFHVVYEKVSGGARSPVRVVEQRTGQEVTDMTSTLLMRSNRAPVS